MMQQWVKLSADPCPRGTEASQQLEGLLSCSGPQVCHTSQIYRSPVNHQKVQEPSRASQQQKRSHRAILLNTVSQSHVQVHGPAASSGIIKKDIIFFSLPLS